MPPPKRGGGNRMVIPRRLRDRLTSTAHAEASPSLATVDVLPISPPGRGPWRRFAHSTFHAPWGLEITDHGPLSFHASSAAAPGSSRRTRGGANRFRLEAATSPSSARPTPIGWSTTPPPPPSISMAEEWRFLATLPIPQRRGGAATVLAVRAFASRRHLRRAPHALPPVLACTTERRGHRLPPWRVRPPVAEFPRRRGSRPSSDRLLGLLLVFALRSWFPPADAAPRPGTGRWTIRRSATPSASSREPARAWTVDSLGGKRRVEPGGVRPPLRRAGDRPPLTYLTGGAWPIRR